MDIYRWTWAIGPILSVLACSLSLAIEAPGQGALRALNDQGKFAELPLIRTRVEAEISGVVARVSVEQIFRNPLETPIDAVYIFPLSANAAVHEMSIQVQERFLRGIIMPRKQARRSFENAQEQGHQAGLLELQEGHVFIQSVANIEADSEVRVLIEYIAPLDYDDGRTRFIFPMVVIPRYPLGEGGWEDPRSWHGATIFTPPDTRSGTDIDISVTIASGLKLKRIDSPSHELLLEQTDDLHVSARLETERQIPNTDFVLDVYTDPEAQEIGLLAHRVGEYGYFNLTLMPRPDPHPDSAPNRELIFVLDTSGSMAGEPLETAKKLMLNAIENIREYDSFNVVVFGSSARVLFGHSVIGDLYNRERASERIRGLETDGGTEIVAALNKAFDLPRDRGRERVVVVISDGAVGPMDQILRVVKHRPKKIRLFTVGLGSGPNHSLLGQMAKLGAGASVSISAYAPTEDTIRRFYQWISTSYLTDIEIDWGTAPVELVNPQVIPDMFPGRPLVISARYSWGAEETITLRGRRAGTPWEYSFQIKLPESEEGNRALAAHWAQQEIQALEDELLTSQDPAIEQQILKLALEHHLVTAYTSLVVVNEDLVVSRQPAGRENELKGGIDCCRVKTGGFGAIRATAFSVAMVEDLPVMGREYQNVLALAPGMEDSTGEGNPNVHGTHGRYFQMQVDGVSGVNPLTAVSASNLNPDSIEEIKIIDPGSDASSTDISGLGRVTTKQGSNEHEGSATLEWTPARLNQADAPYEGSADPSNLRLGVTVGGPLKRDRLWFFVSQDFRHKQSPLAIAQGPDAVVTGQVGHHSSNLAWRVSPKHKLRASFRYNTSAMSPAFVTTLVPASSSARHSERDTALSFSWLSSQAPNFYFEASTDYSERRARVTPMEPWGLPTELELDMGGVQHGPWPSSRTEDVRLLGQHFRFEQFLSGFLGGDHRLVGELSALDYTFDRTLRHRDLKLTDGGLDAELLFAGSAETQGAGTSRLSTRIRDSYTPLSQLNIRLALRYWAESLDGPGWQNIAPGAERAQWDQFVESCLASSSGSVGECMASGALSLFTVRPEDLPGATDCAGSANPWQCSMIATAMNEGRIINVRAPERFKAHNSGLDLEASIYWDPWDDGKSRLAASWKRGHGGTTHLSLFAESLSFGSSRLVDHPGQDGALHGGYGAWQLSRDLEAERFSEWSLLAEREIATETSFSVRYRRRHAWNVLDFRDVNSRAVTWESALASVADRDSRCVQIGEYADCFGDLGVNATGELIDGPDGVADLEPLSPFLGPLPTLGSFGRSQYSELQLSLVRRYYENWELRASYNYSRNQGSGGSAEAELGSLVFSPSSAPGPGDLDQRHLLKLTGRVYIPYGAGFRLAATIDWRSGTPYSIVQDTLSSSYPTNLGSGDQPYLFRSVTTRRSYPTGARNDQRNPSNFEFNLRVAKDLNLENTKLTLGLVVYDLLNEKDLTIMQLQRVVSTSADGTRVVTDHPVGYYRAGRRLQLVAGLRW